MCLRSYLYAHLETTLVLLPSRPKWRKRAMLTEKLVAERYLMFRAVDWDLCGVRYVRLQAGVLLFKLCAFFNVQPPSELEFNLHIILPPLPHPYQRIPYFPPRSGTNARGVFVFSALCGYFRLGWAFSFRFCMRYVFLILVVEVGVF